MTQTVVNFPKAKQRSAQKTPDQLAANVRSAYRKLVRALKEAKNAGLEIEFICDNKEPVIRRRL